MATYVFEQKLPAGSPAPFMWQCADCREIRSGFVTEDTAKLAGEEDEPECGKKPRGGVLI